jgi:large subunit ribosomal protein L3
MINAILGTKVNQSQQFTASGGRIPVTHIVAGPCVVVDIKTQEKDGYDALSIGLGGRRPVTLTKPELGKLKKAGLDKNPPRFLKEIRINRMVEASSDLTPGKVIQIADVFKVGDMIAVSGISKGKGFAGVVKRHHFKGGPRTHGQSDRERAPGSIGQTTTPGRVYKGKRMAGRMGNEKVTVKKLKVISIDNEKNLLTVSGLVPGGRNGLLIIKKMTD